MSYLPSTQKLYQQFPAFKHKNYRLYFSGQLVSFTGSWLHSVAYSWLVFNLTHSAFWLGIESALGSIPVLTLSLFGGFLVDKLNRKKMLLSTQTVSLVLAGTLGILTITHLINLPILLLVTFLSGTANAMDNPASNAFVVDIVDKEDLPSAIGLNSTMFNTGRVLGPSIAGFLIALVGIGNIFLINAASFLAILLSIYFIQVTTHVVKEKDEHPVDAIKEGIAYSFSHPFIRVLLATAAIGAIFCFSQATIMPIFVSQVFATGTQGLGYLMSAAGFGALLGSLTVSSKHKKAKAQTFMMIGCMSFLVSTFLFSFTTNILLACFCLVLSGFGLTLQFSTTYSTIQRLVKEEFRGRVSSIYVLLFVGFGSLGNLFIGTTTSLFGPQEAIRLCTLIILLYSAGVYMYVKRVRTKLQPNAQEATPSFLRLLLDPIPLYLTRAAFQPIGKPIKILSAAIAR